MTNRLEKLAEKLKLWKIILGVPAILITMLISALTILNLTYSPNLEAVTFYLQNVPAHTFIVEEIKSLEPTSLEDLKNKNPLIDSWIKATDLSDKEISDFVDFHNNINSSAVRRLLRYDLKSSYTYVKVHNNSNKTLKNTVLRGLRHPRGIIIRENGTEERFESQEVLNLGQLIPKETLEIYIFEAFGLDYGDSALIHSEGEGRITFRPIEPYRLFQRDGIFISHKIVYTLIFILIIGLFISVEFLTRLKKRRSE